MICRRGHVTRKEIGAIRIFDRETRFEIVEEAAERFAEAALGKTAKGENIRFERSEPPEAGGPRPDAAPRRDRPPPKPRREEEGAGVREPRRPPPREERAPPPRDGAPDRPPRRETAEPAGAPEAERGRRFMPRAAPAEPYKPGKPGQSRGATPRPWGKPAGKPAARASPAGPEAQEPASFRPATPARMRPMQASLAGVAASPNRTMPSTAVPIVPMPVHTA